MRYPSRSPMAVPKQKQSHSRTSKRRAQHKIAAPTYNACPQCHSPRLPAPGLPGVRHLRRARGRARARRTITTTSTSAGPGHWVASAMNVTVAVDANGADLGPAEVAAGAG